VHVSARKCRVLSDIIELLSADYADSRDLRSTIGGSLLDLLDADLYASYLWNSQKQAFERGVAINMDGSYAETYESYLQRCHATSTRRWMRHGVNPVSAIIPHRDLMRTEIYNDFLRPSGHYYGINLSLSTAATVSATSGPGAKTDTPISIATRSVCSASSHRVSHGR